jgi:orotidine-5'-phosphate decarboxylase
MFVPGDSTKSLVVDIDTLMSTLEPYGTLHTHIIAFAKRVRATGVCLRVGSVLASCGHALITGIHDEGLSVCIDMPVVWGTKYEVYTHASLLERMHPELVTASCHTSIRAMSILKQSLPDTRVLGVLALPCMNGEELFQVYGHVSQDAVSMLARRADTAQFDGYLCRPEDLSLLKECHHLHTDAVEQHRVCMVSDVRPAWYKKSRGAVVGTTPRTALSVGATHVIVGKPITLSSDPCGAIMRTREEMDMALSLVS